MKVKSKIAIITGASSGIGEATAMLLHKKGARVVLVARSKGKLQTLAKKLSGILTIPTDVTKEKDLQNLIEKTMEQFGRIDIWINNAGQGYHVPIMDIDNKKYHDLFDLNVVAPLRSMQLVYPIMKKQGRGTIVNISSGTSLMVIPGIGAYSSMKRALNAISLTAAQEFKKDHILVSTVYPYITKTNFHHNLLNGAIEMKQRDGLAPFDEPEYIALKIVEGIEKEKMEIYAHEWMKSS